MNKKKLIVLSLLLAGISAHAGELHDNEYNDWQDGLIWNDSLTPRFRVPATYELESNKKLTVAFDQFFRVVDEYNREHGIDKRYVKDFYGKIPEYNEDVDAIPVWIEEKWDTTLKTKSPKYLTKAQIHKLIVDPKGNKDISDSFSKNFNKAVEYRFYFGNGNEVDQLVFEKEDTFKNTKNDENTKYLVDGKYELYNNGGTFNPLGITEEEYNTIFLDKNGNRVSKNNPKLVQFMKDKLTAKGLKVTEKDGELYINKGGKDGKDGKDRRIIWNAYTLSIPEKDFFTDKQYYKNTVLTKILTFKDYENGDEISYKKNGDIVLKDIFKEDENKKDENKKDKNSKFNFGWGELTPATNGKVYAEELTKDYLAFKNGDLSEKDFKERWSFTDDSFETELAPIQAKNKEIAENATALHEKVDKLGGEGGYGNETLYYRYFEASSWSVSQDDKDAIFAGTDKQAKEYMEANGLSVNQFQDMLNNIKDLRTAKNNLTTDLENLKNGITIERFSTADLKENLKGRKEIMLGGQGRINNLIDLGSGYNTLVINENDQKYTGKFGTNIVFGPELKLKNVNVVGVGRQESATLGAAGLSGLTSLAIEIDSNKVDDKGRLYQHALKDTWTDDNKVIFRKTKGFSLEDKFRNDFLIEFRTSVIGKDGTVIDIGRPLEYKGIIDDYNYKINLKPDTVVQKLVTLDEKSTAGNDLVKIEFKKSVEGLNTEENAVYKSLVNSGKINTLSPTLTISNKKTIFSTPEADRLEVEKNMKLALALKDENLSVDDLLKELPDFKIEDEKLPYVKALVEGIKNNKVSSQFTEEEQKEIASSYEQKIQKYRGMNKTLVKYKKIDTSDARNAMAQVVNEFKDVREDMQNITLDSITKKYGSTDKVQEKVNELKAFAEKHIRTLHNDLVAAAPDSSKGEEEVSVKLPSFPGLSNPGQTLRGMENLFNPNPYGYKTPEEQLKNLISNYRVYLPAVDRFNELDEKYIDATMLSELQRDEIFKQIRLAIYYSQRETESLKEFKTIINQIQNKNIYAKVNKISKDEIDMFMPMVIDHKFDFTSKKSQATGGAISSRFAKDEFKGTIYTGYGIYETPVKENLSLGFVVGGGSSDFHEIVNDDNKTKTTNSKIKGTRAYLGTFGRYQVKPNLTWVNGVGVQYAKYDVDRDMVNNYQQDTFKGDVNTYTGNIYSNLAYIYKVNDTLNASIKGGLSYTLVNQGKVKEEDKAASIEVDSQNFNYLDGQVGVGLTKTIYGNEMSSSLGGTLSAVYGIAGYDNDDLNGRFKGSTSDFGIKGESHSKESVRLKLDYNVIYNAGFNYGLEGTYTTNSDEDNISVGIKAGYTF